MSLGVAIVVGVVVVVAIVVAALTIRRDRGLRMTRVGWFVERERYPAEDVAAPEHAELPSSLRDAHDDDEPAPPDDERDTLIRPPL